MSRWNDVRRHRDSSGTLWKRFPTCQVSSAQRNAPQHGIFVSRNLLTKSRFLDFDVVGWAVPLRAFRMLDSWFVVLAQGTIETGAGSVAAYLANQAH